MNKIKNILLIDSGKLNCSTLYKHYLLNKDKYPNIKNIILFKPKSANHRNLFVTINTIFNKYNVVCSEYMYDIENRFAKYTIFFNHGWGTKLMPGKIAMKRKESVKRWYNFAKYTDFIICLSDFDKTYFLTQNIFKKIKPKFFPLGSPRNDLFFSLNNSESIKIYKNEIINKLKLDEKDTSKKLILYAPTWREEDDAIKSFFNTINKSLYRITKILYKMGYIFIFRPHHLSFKYLHNKQNLSINEKLFTLLMSDYPDTHKLLLSIDYLITDYSSIFVDFLLLNKPIIFYPFDIDNYSKKRGLAIDFNNDVLTPGPKINSLFDLIDILNNNILNNNYWKNNRIKALNNFYKYPDGNSSERILKFINNL